MQNFTRSYMAALNVNTRTVQHISTVNHWLRDVVYHVSVEYTAFTTGRERIKKIEGEVVARDRARAITTAPEQAAEQLASLKETSEKAFNKKVIKDRQGPVLSPAAATLLEAKKSAKLAQLAAAKARKAANEANIEADKEHDGFHSSTLPPIQPSTKPLPMNTASLNQLQTTSQQQQQNTKRKINKGKSKHKKMQCVNMNNENAPPQSNQWSSYRGHQIVTPTPEQGSNTQLFPTNPSGINTHQHFPQECPPQVSGQHFVPTPDFCDQQRNTRQIPGHYVLNHHERPHRQLFQNCVWNRPGSLNNSSRAGTQQAHQNQQQNRRRNRSRGKVRQGDPDHPASAINGGK
jgi:hypothetical protein